MKHAKITVSIIAAVYTPAAAADLSQSFDFDLYRQR
jgi:hypothetical protein